MGETKYAVCGRAELTKTVLSAIQTDPTREVTPFSELTQLASFGKNTTIVVVAADEASLKIAQTALANNLGNCWVIAKPACAGQLPTNRHVLRTLPEQVGFLKSLRKTE